MPKRDHDTEIWSEDWFVNLSDSEMLFWFYIKDRCDHAGFWRPNFVIFEKITGRRINQQDFLNKMNSDKKRIEVLENGKWFITGYIAFQFCESLNINNKFHASVLNIFMKNINCENTSIYGFEVKQTSGRPLADLNKERITNNEKRDNKGGPGGEIENAIEAVLRPDKSDPIVTVVGKADPSVDNAQGINKPDKKETWRTSYVVWQQEEQDAYNNILNDNEWMEERERLKPYTTLNLKKTIENAHGYWKSEAAWKHRKKSKTKDLDWKTTYINSITQKINQVFDDRKIEYSKNSVEKPKEDWDEYLRKREEKKGVKIGS